MKKSLTHVILHSSFRTFLLNVCIFLIYIVAGKLGLSFASLNPSATAIWPPTGIALAVLLIFGYRVIPAILLGAFVVNITTSGTIITSLGIALGNTLEGVLGMYLVKKYSDGINTFENVSSIFKFVFFAAILSTSISADIGVITLILGHLAIWKNFIAIWTTWWLGDMGGNLIIAPIILIWCVSERIYINFKSLVHILLSFFVLLLTTWIIFSGIFPYVYLSIPIAIWIAFWFGRKGATLTTLIVAIIAIFYTLHGYGPFTQNTSINQSLILLQLFISILSVTSLIFAALVHALRKREKTLEYHDARFKALIEKSFDAVLLVDATSKILYASPSVNRVLQYEPEELIGMTGFDLIIPEDRQFTIRTLAKLVLKPGNTITIEYRVIQKNKNVIWVEATGTNLLFDQAVNAVVVNFRDITEKKVLQENILQEKTEDEAMLASIGDGIIAADHTGKITMVNKSACDTLGWTKRELIGKLLTEIIPMEDETGTIVPLVERPISKVLSLRRNVVTSRTFYYEKKDKSYFPVRFRVTPIEIDQKIVGIIEVFQDITREKEIDRMKDEFISMASHELRTPMTAINGLLSMIFHGDYGPINEKLKHPLDNIQISAKRQIHLINDLLDVSRLQTGKIDFNFADFSVKPMLDEIVKSLMPIAQQKGLTLIIQGKEELSVNADIEWSKHIMNNLIGNALKFTDKGSVSLTYYAKDTVIYIDVTDTGSGIDLSDSERLFGKFQQLSGKDIAKPPGSGLGLYLSRELAQKMNGDVQLSKSIVGKGSTFTLILPKTNINTPQAIKTRKEKIAFSSKNK
jgi:PAS domain S-box-containing protein